MLSILFICLVCVINFAAGFALAMHFGHGPKDHPLLKRFSGKTTPPVEAH